MRTESKPVGANQAASYLWRTGWDARDPKRPCYTCGARPIGQFSDGSPRYNCHLTAAISHVPILLPGTYDRVSADRDSGG